MPTENLFENSPPSPESVQPAIGTASKVPWHAPTLTRITLKRTMINSGTQIDGLTGSVTA